MKRNGGITLLELLMTLAIVAILLGIGVPAFVNTIACNRLATQINDFVGITTLARSEAIKRGARISFCPSDPTEAGNGGQTICVGGWADGWTVLVDADGNCAIDAGTDPLRAHGALDRATLSALTDPGAAAVSCIGYTGQGYADVASGDTIVFTFCSTSVDACRVFELNELGRLTRTSTTGTACPTF